MRPTISLVTITYNSATTLPDTISSVLSQSLQPAEYIIKDGGSTDATADIVASYGDKIRWIAQPDKGIYDAMNQGIAAATGEIIGLINSDDFYADTKVLERVLHAFEATPTLEAVYGDLVYVDANDVSKITRRWVAGTFSHENFLKGWMPPHPTFFVRRSVYERYGLFDTSFKSAGDYELMLRLLYKRQINVGYIPQVLVKMRAGGVSNASLKNRIRANREDRRAWQQNGLVPRWYTLYAKPLSKLTQWLLK